MPCLHFTISVFNFIPALLPCPPPCSYTFFKVAEEEYEEEEEAAPATPLAISAAAQ